MYSQEIEDQDLLDAFNIYPAFPNDQWNRIILSSHGVCLVFSQILLIVSWGTNL